jgi:hypothetical protein
MSGVSRESKIFYSVGPCQLYDINTYVRLMVIKKQKHWTSRTTMRNESVPEPFKEQIAIHITRLRKPIQPLTRNTISICCMRKRFLKNKKQRKNCPISRNAEMSSYMP